MTTIIFVKLLKQISDKIHLIYEKMKSMNFQRKSEGSLLIK